MPEKPFKMPDAELGQTVLWYPDGLRSTEPVAAIVSKLAHRSLNLNILQPMNYNFIVRDGVRHLDDPDLKDQERLDAGAWDYTPRDKAISHLLRELHAPQKK